MAGKPQLFHVAVVAPAGRPFELRYHCPIEKRKVRRSTGTYDRKEAEELAKSLAAELRTGSYRKGPTSVGWEEFRAKYDLEELRVHHRDGGARQYNGVLDAFTAIVRPQTLDQAITAEAMLKFRNGYAAGEHSRFGTRSAHTVISGMAALVAVFRWAKVVYKLEQDVPELPRFRPPAKKREAKGRPLTDDQVAKYIAAVPQVVGESAAASWIELINGMLESALRLEEAIELSWDDRSKIRPKWTDSGLATIVFPGAEHKNAEDDEIPMPPGFERILLRTPKSKRKGYVFNPQGIALPRPAGGRPPNPGRVSADWAGKILTRVGEASGVIVEPAKGTPPRPEKPAPKPKRKKGVVNKRKRKRTKVTRSATYTPPKYASAHDLRRTCAERMIDAGVDPLIVSRIMRHKSFETTKKFYAKGNLQKAAERLRFAMSGSD